MKPKHHPTLAPSSLPAIAICPCFQSSAKSSIDADRGTALHKAIEEALKGETPEVEENDLPAVEYAYSEVLEILAAFGATSGDLRLEDEVIVYKDDKELTYGTLDVWFLTPSGLVVIDFKFGQVRNYKEQMAAYALGLMQKTDVSQAKIYEVYGTMQFKKEYFLSRQDAEELVYWTAEKTALQDRKPSGCEYCKWCQKINICPEVVGSVNAIVPIDNLDCSVADADTLKKMYQAIAVIDAWKETVKEEVMTRAKLGILPWGKIKETKGNKSISDAVLVPGQIGLSMPDVLAVAKISMTNLKKVVAEKTGMSQKKAEEFILSKVNINYGNPKESLEIL